MAQNPLSESARRGRRVAEGAFLVIAAWFAISSTWQITQSALFAPPPASPSAP